MNTKKIKSIISNSDSLLMTAFISSLAYLVMWLIVGESAINEHRIFYDPSSFLIGLILTGFLKKISKQ